MGTISLVQCSQVSSVSKRETDRTNLIKTERNKPGARQTQESTGQSEERPVGTDGPGEEDREGEEDRSGKRKSRRRTNGFVKCFTS